jgi:hypothetical protein
MKALLYVTCKTISRLLTKLIKISRGKSTSTWLPTNNFFLQITSKRIRRRGNLLAGDKNIHANNMINQGIMCLQQAAKEAKAYQC